MNWLQYFTKSISALPYIIAGIQAIHADAKGADKKTLALESLGLATATAGVLLPPDQAAQAQAVSGAVGSIIDNLVTALHGLNAPGFGTNSKPAA